MGCDIHLHIEVKLNGRWEHYAIPRIDRWYKLFTIMAGVRGESKPISEPKGLPEDISIITKLSYESMKDDAHTESWLNEDEIDMLSEWAKDEIGDPHFYSLESNVLNGTYLFDNSLTAFKNCKNDMNIEGVRLVFWFDN